MRLPRNDSRAALLALALAGLGAGAACDRVPANAVESCATDVRLAAARTDILVVVDDSESMSEEQENLRRNLSAFVDALAASPIPHDFQIGVTTTSVDNTNDLPDEYPYYSAPYDGVRIPYPAGRLVAVDPRALADPALRGLLLWDGAAARFTGSRVLAGGSSTVVEDVETNVLVGTRGSRKEEPLRAAELALTARLADGTNAGFLRPGARLGIIVLTDEDDCSENVPRAQQVGTSDALCHQDTVKARLESLDAFTAFLEGPIGGEARDPVLAVIAGFDPATLAATGCATSYDAPTRLSRLVDGLGTSRSFKGSICDESFWPSLQRIADLLVPQTVPLEGAPADPRMLLASIRRASETIRCPVAATGDASALDASAVYTPPQEGRSATLTFQGACRLQAGDQVQLAVVCVQ